MTKRKTETVNDLSRCLDPLDMDATLIASSWLVGGIIPGVERQPLKKLAIDEHALLKLLSRWRQGLPPDLFFAAPSLRGF
jgi:transposase